MALFACLRLAEDGLRVQKSRVAPRDAHAPPLPAAQVLGAIYLIWRALRSVNGGWIYFYSIPFWCGPLLLCCPPAPCPPACLILPLRKLGGKWLPWVVLIPPVGRRELGVMSSTAL